MKIKPMAGYIVVKTEEVAKQTASGFYIPSSAQERSKVAEVVTIAKDIDTVKVGDKVLYRNEYEAITVTIDKKEFFIVSAADVIAKIG